MQFEITERARKSVFAWIRHASLKAEDYVFSSRLRLSPHLSTRQYARIVEAWVGSPKSPGRRRLWDPYDAPHERLPHFIGRRLRYVVDALKSDERQAVPLSKDISELYRLERVAKDRGLTDEQRGYFRHAKAKPVLKRLRAQFRELEHTAPPTGNLRDAVTYAKNRWLHLSGYAKAGFGHVHIDNNRMDD